MRGSPHGIGGAIAYGFFGAARGTHAVDINLFVPGDAAAPALNALVAAGLEIDEPLALTTAAERGDARGMFKGLPVDLFFNSIPVHERAATRTREVTLHGVRLRVLSPEDTAIFKMLFFRGKDLVDVERLLGIMQGSLDRAYVRAALVEVLPNEEVGRTRRAVGPGVAASAWRNAGEAGTPRGAQRHDQSSLTVNNDHELHPCVSSPAI